MNQTRVFAIFDDADNSSANFTARLLAEGIASRTDAKPLAIAWASRKYRAKVTKGNQGDKLPRNSDAERAMYRVLSVCFPKADLPKPKASANKADPVARLLKSFKALTPAEKRRFKAAI